jgi:polyisoprenoid-binding protein YceI
VRKIQRKMLDEGHLDAQHHPQIRLDLMAAGPVTDGAVRARVRLDLHGVTRELELPVRVDALDDRALRFSGEMRVRQRDFGIEPESIAGVVKVKDEVDLHFDLVATRTTRSCARGEP